MAERTAAKASEQHQLLMLERKTLLMVVECRAHAGQIVRALDEAKTGDWIILTGMQARRFGELVGGLITGQKKARIIVGIGDSEQIRRTLNLVADAVHRESACPNCAAYVWKVDRVPFKGCGARGVASQADPTHAAVAISPEP